MKIYGGSFGAHRKEFYSNGTECIHNYTPVTLNSVNETTAIKTLMAEALKKYPKKDGWFNHYAGVMPITVEQYEAAGYVRKF